MATSIPPSAAECIPPSAAECTRRPPLHTASTRRAHAAMHGPMRGAMLVTMLLQMLLGCTANLSRGNWQVLQHRQLQHDRSAVASSGEILLSGRLTGSSFDADVGLEDAVHISESEALTTSLALRGGGGTLSRLLPVLMMRQRCKILMLGLDSAGKTTIVYQLKLGEMTSTTPTLGVNVETITYKNIEFMVMDMGGQDKIRQLWSHYYEGGDAIIFVVDSADRERMEEAKAELAKLMTEEALRDALLLVYANKQDLPEALSVNEVAEGLGLTDLHRKRTWYIQACSASSGDGLTDGLEWLVARLLARQKRA